MNKLFSVIGLSCLLACGSIVNAAVFSGRGVPSATTLGETTANVMAVNPDGVGHVLLFPYFSAQNGNATIFSITNTDYLNAKAVKLRFRGAASGDTVFDLTVFLPPNDVWNGVVTQNGSTGLAQLSTADTSCTLPAMSPGVGYTFNTGRINPSLNVAEQANQTREGSVEVIVMADIPPVFASASLYASIAHNAGVPVNCGAAPVVATLVDAASESAAAAMGFATPTTGLEGSWTLINVPQTLTFSGDATAVQALSNVTGAPGRANYVLFPQTGTSALGVDGLTADPLMRTSPSGSKSATGVFTSYVPASGGLPVIKAVMNDFPDLSTPYLSGMTIPSQQASELSRVLAVKSVANDYSTDRVVSAATDWVFSFPTKRYSIGVDYRQSTPAVVYSLMPGKGGIEYFSDALTTAAAALPKIYYDREAGRRVISACSSGCDASFALKGSTSVVSFATSTASVLASSVSLDFAGVGAFANGWGVVDTSNGGAGLPVLGAAFIRANNPAAAVGVSGNYGITSGHRFTR